MDVFIKQSIDSSIPLLCCVCPKAPHFSDVSHLLTHIASKGHLHHETQMKLRSHQDITAAMALQKYDQWYTRHNIEDLLVQRMKAKQSKEAARQKRRRKLHTYNSLPFPNPTLTESVNHAATSNVKVESEPSEHHISIYPDPLPSDNDLEAWTFYQQSEISKLKGQYWPGMGKLDLANEDMKRTRNQRKPKSSVERMRKASESIAPTQVVMNLDFEVEVVKGVYDPSSPVPIDDDMVPVVKVSRPRKKKAKVLQELSSNVPPTAKRRKMKDGPSGGLTEEPSDLSFEESLFYKVKSPIDPFIGARQPQYHNENVDFGVYPSRAYSSPSMDHSLYPYHDTLSVSDFNLISHQTPFSHSSSVTASASSERSKFKTSHIENQYISQDGQEYLTQSYLQSKSPYHASYKSRTYSRVNQLSHPDTLNPCLTSNQYRAAHFHSQHSPAAFLPPPPEQESPFLGATSNNPLYLSHSQRYRHQSSNHLDNTHQLFAPSIFGSLSRSHSSDDVFGKSEEEYSPTPRGSKLKRHSILPTEVKEDSELTGNPWTDAEIGMDCTFLDNSTIDLGKADATIS